MTRSHLIRRLVVAGLLAALTAVVPVTAQNVSDGDLLLREALHKQQVEGDLPSAIKIYQQIVTANRNRATVARALLEIAGCYEKLGQQAESVYQQIVREFGDQPAAVQARARLAALRPSGPPPTMTLRKVELGDDVQNVVASDGQRVVYWDPTNATLYFGDVAGREKRVVLQTKRIHRAVVSRDLSMVFLFFPVFDREAAKFAVVKTDGTGYRDLTLTEKGIPLLPDSAPPCLSWSWDNRFVLMCKSHEGGANARLLKVSVADGVVQDLLPGRAGADAAAFSPDGRYVAYSPHGALGPVYVIPVQGGEGRLVAPSARLADWTPDGRYVLIAEPRVNSLALAAVRVVDGQPIGEPISLRAVPGIQARTMANGALLVSTPPSGSTAAFLGTLDSTNRVMWTELNLINQRVANFPYWSPDGTRITYVSGDPRDVTNVVRIRNVATGQDRELYRGDFIFGCIWAHRRPVIYCNAAKGPGIEILEVSVESGRVQKVGSFDGPRGINYLSPDDQTMRLVNIQGSNWSDWEMGTNRETVVSYTKSEDGRWFLDRLGIPQNPGTIRVRLVSDPSSDWRLLAQRRLSLPAAITIVPVRFTADGNWVVYHDRDPDGTDGLYRVATAGGPPERLGDYPTSDLSSALSVSPDGRQFVSVLRRLPRQPEFWLLENFLPTAAASTKAGQPKRDN